MAHSFPVRFGEALLSLGRITRGQLNTALALQLTVRKPLGTVLLDLGACSERDVQAALSFQHGLELIDLDVVRPRLELLPAHFALSERLVPVRMMERPTPQLLVASAGPLSTVIQREACVMAGVPRLEVRLCTASALARGLAGLRRAGGGAR